MSVQSVWSRCWTESEILQLSALTGSHSAHPLFFFASHLLSLLQNKLWSFKFCSWVTGHASIWSGWKDFYVETRTSWCHRLVFSLASFQKQMEPMYTLVLIYHCRVGKESSRRSQWKRLLAFPGRLSWRSSLGTYKFAVVKIIRSLSLQVSSLLCWDWDLPHCKGAGITENCLPDRHWARNVQPLNRKTPWSAHGSQAAAFQTPSLTLTSLNDSACAVVQPC